VIARIEPTTAAPASGRTALQMRPWLGLAASAVGAIAIGFGLTHDPARTWSNLLVDGFFVLSIALGGMVFNAIHHLCGAAWSAGMRRVAEGLMATLPIGAVMMAALFFGRASLFAWASRASSLLVDGAVAQTTRYFAVPFVFSRMALFLSVWIAFAAFMRRTSASEDVSADPTHRRRMMRGCAAFIVVFALSFSLASIDWLLSLDPAWTSTIYAVYVFAGLLVEAVASITLVVVLLVERGQLGEYVTANHLHDLGKLLLALTTFWAYIWLSQYLLIWYSNIPEEASYYQIRTDGHWVAWFAANLIVNWVVPFIVLLPRAAKRDPAILKWTAALVLFGRWLDLYLLVMPQTTKTPVVGTIEVSIAIAYGGLAWYVLADALARRPLVVRHDSVLGDCVRHHQ
jgi:hypothetical protein